MRTDKGDYHSAGPCGCEGSAQIVKATTRGQESVWKLAFRPPLVALSNEIPGGIFGTLASSDSGVRTFHCDSQ